MKRPVQVGLIGCGIQGTVLAQSLLKAREAKLVAVTDVNEESSKKAKEQFRATEYFTNHADLLAMEDIDAVMIAVPHSLLEGITINSLRAGKHVFVEKPMATSPAGATKIIEESKKAGVNLMVGYCLRYDPARVRLKRIVDSGALGEPRMIISAKGCPPFYSMWPELKWLMSKENGGGILMFLGVHMIDQMLWLAGGEVEAVSAQVNLMKGFDVDATAASTIKFRSGLLASISCSMQVNGGVEGGLDEIEVLGDKGAAKADWTLGDPILRVQSAVEEAYREPTSIRFQTRGQFSQMYVDELQEFVNSILEERRPAITAEDGLRVLEIVDAIRRSSAEQRTIRIAPTATTGAGR